MNWPGNNETKYRRPQKNGPNNSLSAWGKKIISTPIHNINYGRTRGDEGNRSDKGIPGSRSHHAGEGPVQPSALDRISGSSEMLGGLALFCRVSTHAYAHLWSRYSAINVCGEGGDIDIHTIVASAIHGSNLSNCFRERDCNGLKMRVWWLPRASGWEEIICPCGKLSIQPLSS